MKLTVLGAAAVSMIGAVAVTERDRTYRSEGWERFDPDAPAYTPRQARDTVRLGPTVTEGGRAPVVAALAGAPSRNIF